MGHVENATNFTLNLLLLTCMKILLLTKLYVRPSDMYWSAQNFMSNQYSLWRILEFNTHGIFQNFLHKLQRNFFCIENWKHSKVTSKWKSSHEMREFFVKYMLTNDTIVIGLKLTKLCNSQTNRNQFIFYLS